jgi:Mn-dependent DtxR family transcriptional regulator
MVDCGDKTKKGKPVKLTEKGNEIARILLYRLICH